MGWQGLQIGAVERQPPGLRLHEAADCLDDRRFAGTVGPDDANDLAGTDADREVVDRGNGP